MEIERGVVGKEKHVQSQRDMKDSIWEVVDNCAWLECEVRASDAMLFKKGIGDGGIGRGRQRMVALYHVNFILSEIQALE